MTSHSPASSPELPDLPKLPAAREFYGHDYVGDKIHAGMGFIDEDMEAYATAHGLACYEAGSAAAAQAAKQVPAGWISVDDERKPEGRKPILVAVQWMNHYEHEDGTPARQEGYDVTEGEYVPQHGERAGHFDSYAGPYDHDGWGITHWMHLPAAPTGEQA